MSAAAPRRRLHPALKLSLLLVGLVAAALLIECAFRVFWTLPPWFAEFQQAGMYAATADGGVALQPGYRGTLQVEGTTHVAINSLGMRGPEPGVKRADERRLLVLGDSLVWGYGVEAEATFAALLPRHLAAAGLPCTVGNGGVPTYGSRHVAAHLARLDQPFGADAFVVCGYLGNDPIDDAMPQRIVFAGLLLDAGWARLVAQSWRARLMYRSRAWLWLESWLHANRPEQSLVTELARLQLDPGDAARAAGFVQDRLAAGLFFDVIDPATPPGPGLPPVVDRQLATLRSSLQAMREQAGTRPLVFVVLPTVWQVVEERRLARLRELGFEPARFERGLAQRRWRETAVALGIPVFDATPILAAAPDPETLFIGDGGHLSVRGHELVAAWLGRELPALLR